MGIIFAELNQGGRLFMTGHQIAQVLYPGEKLTAEQENKCDVIAKVCQQEVQAALANKEFVDARLLMKKTLFRDTGLRQSYVDNISVILLDRLGVQDKEVRDPVAAEILTHLFR